MSKWYVPVPLQTVTLHDGDKLVAQQPFNGWPVIFNRLPPCRVTKALLWLSDEGGAITMDLATQPTLAQGDSLYLSEPTMRVHGEVTLYMEAEGM